MELRIGELSRETGCQIETIRYYERAGILPAPPRTGNNYRCYEEHHRLRLLFVRRCRELGFTLEEIRGLLRLIDGGHYTCGEVQEIGIGHLQTVRKKIADLANMEKALDDLVSRCDDSDSPDCSMLAALFDTRAPD